MDSEIKNSLVEWTGLSASEASEFLRHARIKEVKSQSCFIRAGEVPNELGIVCDGLVRYLYITDDGKEYTKAFMPKGSFVSSYSAMISKTASHFFIEALEDTKVLSISYFEWQRLRKQNPRWSLLLLELLERGYAMKEKRERELLLLDAESRYRNFLREYSMLEGRVRQYMVASYIGITPIALSRIRKKMGL